MGAGVATAMLTTSFFVHCTIQLFFLFLFLVTVTVPLFVFVFFVVGGRATAYRGLIGE
jgi:hypothetical protein